MKVKQEFIPGVLPRLLSGTIPLSPLSDLEQLKKEISFNIESILNSRSRPSFKELNEDPEVQFSVIGMGIDDFCGCQHTGATIKRLKQQMREQLIHFEPRLDPESIEVSVKGEEDGRKGVLIMEITGRICVKPFEGEYLCSYTLDLETGIPSFRKVGEVS